MQDIIKFNLSSVEQLRTKIYRVVKFRKNYRSQFSRKSFFFVEYSLLSSLNAI